MRVVCSFCRVPLGEKPPLDRDELSHGACPPCLEHFERQWEGLSLAEYLDDFEFPVVVVDQDGRFIAANDRMAEQLGQPARSLTGLLGGEAMECVWARLPGGCGRTSHCETCTVRQTVRRTFETGEPQVRVPAWVQREEGRMDVLLSTRRVGPGVRVRIEVAA